MNASSQWYLIDNINEVDSPALVVYLDRVKENIQIAKHLIDDSQRLRPHVKTHKAKEVALLMLQAGINKFKCATIAEAEMLGSAGAADVLLAYQPVGPKAARLVHLIQQYPATRFSCLADHIDAARHLAEVASTHHIIVPVYIDINAGMNRTGIAPGTAAIELYRQCAALKGISPVGFHVYDGHIRHTDFAVRKKESDAAFALVEQMKQTLTAAGFDTPLIIAGGTPTFPVHAQRKNVECSPGTFVYWDAGYGDAYAEQPFLQAALVVTRIISLPDATKICLDLGHKSIAAENELNKRIRFLNAPELKPVSQSEEHLVLEAGSHHAYKIGDVLYGQPYHICPTVALYERALVVQHGKIMDEWQTARDRKITY